MILSPGGRVGRVGSAGLDKWKIGLAQPSAKDVPEQKIHPAKQKLSEKKRIRKEKKCLNSKSLMRGKEKKRYEISLLV